MKKPIDITGMKFGRLTVIRYTHSNDDKKACWDCICDCGNKINTTGKSLRSGNTKSCGCYAKEIRSVANLTHGDCRNGKTKEYYIWRGIKARCLNINNKNYSLYGGRGILICKEWENDYSKFLSDMGRAPFKKATIDRINSNGNYCKDNCRWASMKEQNNNKSNNKLITFQGKTMTAKKWSEITGINYGTIIMRLHRGWTIQKTLNHGRR